jgi:hypothetical protein
VGSSSDPTLDPPSAPLARLQQGIRALLPARPEALPWRLAERLPEPVLAAWQALAPYDRRHQAAVAGDLDASGHPDSVVLAGLLHDIGKAGRITVVDRVGLVLLGRLAPGVRGRLAARERSLPGLNGLHLQFRHAEVGAGQHDRAGMPAEVVWLVRHHERDIDNPELRALQAADRRH